MLEAAEGGRMDDTVAIAAEGAAALADRLGVQPAAALPWIARTRRADYAIHRHRSPGCRQLTLSTGALNYSVDAVAIGASPAGDDDYGSQSCGSQRHRDRTGGAADRRDP